MPRSACTLGRALSLACFFSLLIAGPAYAHVAFVAADFDGDGHGDHVTVSNEQPTILRVWLSSTRTTEVLRSAEPVLRIAAADLDGDHHAELIAADRSSYLRIWTKRHNQFRRYRPLRPPTPGGVSRSTGRATAGRSAPESPTTCTPRTTDGSLAPNLSPGGPSSYEWRRALRAGVTPTPSLSFTLLAPRPPPGNSAI